MIKGKPSLLKIALIVVIVGIVLYFAISAIKIATLNSQRDKALKIQEELLKKKENLTFELDNINSKEHMERLARRDLKLVKPNEILFILPEFKQFTDKNEEGEDKADKEEANDENRS